MDFEKLQKELEERQAKLRAILEALAGGTDPMAVDGMVGDDVPSRMEWLKSEREAVKTQRESLAALRAEQVDIDARMGDDDHKDDDDKDKRNADPDPADGDREPDVDAVRAAEKVLQRALNAPGVRSQRYGDMSFIPNPAMTLRTHGAEGLSVQRLVRGLIFRNHGGSKEASREMDWLERSGFAPSEHSLGATGTIPFSFLSRYGSFTNKDLEARGRTAVQTATSGAGAAGGTFSTIVDPENSMAWLYDKSPVLEKLTTIPGVRGRYQFFYGSNTRSGTIANSRTPEPLPYAEGADFSESSPTFVEQELGPVTIGVTFPITSAMLASDQVGIMSIVEMGTERLIREHLTRQVLSGPRSGIGTSPDFTVQSNAMTGLLNSSLTETGYGANDAAFNRDDVVGAYFRMISNKADGAGLVWIMSVGLATLMANERVGGTESVRFVFEKSASMGMDYEGVVEPGVPGIVSTQLGKTTGNAGSEVAVVNPGVLVHGNRCLVPIWGDGIDVIVFNDPTKGAIELGFRLHANFGMVNPNNGTVIKQGT